MRWTKYHLHLRQISIADILCDIGPNDDVSEFFDVFIAEQDISALKADHHLIHVSEGLIHIIEADEDPTLEGDAWKQQSD